MLKFPIEYWPKTMSRVEFFPSTALPELPVTAVKVYVFQNNELLLANIDSRGWDVPGGHVEPGETPEQAIIRELHEETGAQAERLKRIGYLKITNEEENEYNKKYPKVSCILVYKGYEVAVDSNHSFQLEASESKFIPITQLPRVHHGWSDAKAQVAAYAFSKQ